MDASTSDSSNKLQALVALYQAERSDMSAILNVGLALVGTGAAYAAATIAFSDQLGNSLGWVFVAVLPIPLWLISAFHSIIFAIGAVHGLSAIILEEEIFKYSGINPRHRSLVGALAGEHIMNSAKSTYPHAVATYITYIGVILIITGYTVYTTYISWNGLGAWVYLFVVLYATLFIAVLFSWISGIRTVADSWAKSGLSHKRRQWR